MGSSTDQGTVTDADFVVVRGPYRSGEAHRARRGWVFTGYYDLCGEPLFYNRRHDPRPAGRVATRMLVALLVGTFGSALPLGGLAYLASKIGDAWGTAAALGSLVVWLASPFVVYFWLDSRVDKEAERLADMKPDLGWSPEVPVQVARSRPRGDRQALTSR